jgi:co-chaperonin GroES (HSP10)
MKLQLLGRRVWVEIDEHGGVTKGGIIVPQKSAQITRKGTVIAAGEESRFIAGDRVLLSIYAGVNLHILEENLSSMENIICSEDEILARITEE